MLPIGSLSSQRSARRAQQLLVMLLDGVIALTRRRSRIVHACYFVMGDDRNRVAPQTESSASEIPGSAAPFHCRTDHARTTVSVTGAPRPGAAHCVRRIARPSPAAPVHVTPGSYKKRRRGWRSPENLRSWQSRLDSTVCPSKRSAITEIVCCVAARHA
jgi:hypothetical protein